MFTGTNYSGTQYSYDYNNNPHGRWLFVGGQQNDVAEAIDSNRQWPTGVGKDSPPNNGQAACDEGAVPNLFNKSWPNGSSAAASISSFYLASSSNVECAEIWP
jgi:hypothetical protein